MHDTHADDAQSGKQTADDTERTEEQSQLFMHPSTYTSDRTDIRVHDRHHSWKEVYDLLEVET